MALQTQGAMKCRFPLHGANEIGHAPESDTKAAYAASLSPEAHLSVRRSCLVAVLPHCKYFVACRSIDCGSRPSFAMTVSGCRLLPGIVNKPGDLLSVLEAADPDQISSALNQCPFFLLSAAFSFLPLISQLSRLAAERLAAA